MVDGIKLREELSLNGLGAVIFSTFNLNLQFFEQVILPKLRSQGCRTVLVLVDEAQFQVALASEGYEPIHLGRSWAVVPLRAAGAFHPKFTLLLGQRESRLLMGSHNLTFSGYGRNCENTLVWATKGKAADAQPAQDLWSFFKHWVSDQPPGVQVLVQQIEHEWPWLLQKGQTLPWSVIGSSRTGPSLWDQLQRLLPNNAFEVIAIGPYFDEKLHFLEELQSHWPKAKTTVGIQPGFTHISKSAKKLFPNVRFKDLSQWAPAKGTERFVHSKCILILQKVGSGHLVTGSANPSKQAWLDSSAKRNAELVAVQSFQKIDHISLAFDLAAIRDLPEMNQEGWDQTNQTWETRKSSVAGGSASVAIAWRIGNVISIFGPKSVLKSTDKFHVEAVRGTYPVPNPHEGKDGDLQFEIPQGIPLEELCWVVQTNSKGIHKIPILHQDILLEAATRTASALSVKAALQGIEDDLVGLEEHLKIIEKVILDHADLPGGPGPGSRRNLASSSEESDGATFQGPSIIPLHELVRSRHSRRLRETDTLAMLIDSLFYRLGQGLHSDVDKRVELIDVGAEDQEKLNLGEESLDVGSLQDQEERNERVQKRVRSLLKRLTRQAEATVKSGTGHSMRIEQTAAVLAVVRHLARLESRNEASGVRFLDSMDLQVFLADISQYLLAPGRGIVDKALEENEGSSFEELSLVLALLIWVSQHSGLRVRTHLFLQDEDDKRGVEALRRDLEDETILLHTILAAIRDKEAITIANGQESSREFKQWLQAHLVWAKKVSSALSSVTSLPTGHALRRGDMGAFKDGEEWIPSLVVDAHPGKVRVFDVGRDETRIILRPYLKAIPWNRERWYYEDH